mmetsp:Transcript_32267/g.78378  ORF Transcript_32267/g.78378 Transcript_32267/m.78378 type:complete len:83 (-) Transcript_32267:865-1113(-)
MAEAQPFEPHAQEVAAQVVWGVPWVVVALQWEGAVLQVAVAAAPDCSTTRVRTEAWAARQLPKEALEEALEQALEETSPSWP